MVGVIGLVLVTLGLVLLYDVVSGKSVNLVNILTGNGNTSDTNSNNTNQPSLPTLPGGPTFE